HSLPVIPPLLSLPSLFSLHLLIFLSSFFFFFNDTATTEIYTLSLHDALPIYPAGHERRLRVAGNGVLVDGDARAIEQGLRCLARDRKSTRLNSSHRTISYAVFCLKKKKKNNRNIDRN